MVYSKTLGVSYLYIRKHHRNNIMSKNLNENTRNLGIRTFPPGIVPIYMFTILLSVQNSKYYRLLCPSPKPQ